MPLLPCPALIKKIANRAAKTWLAVTSFVACRFRVNAKDLQEDFVVLEDRKEQGSRSSNFIS
jgi:hypothetical protein